MNELAKELKLSPRYFERVQTKNGKTHGRIMFNGPYCRELFKEGYVRNPALYAHDALVGFL